MTDAFDGLINPLIGVEGGYVDHPADRGGPTIWGITQAKAREHHYNGDMRLMSKGVAIGIYRLDFWINPGLDEIALISVRLAAEMLDTGVNMGVGVPGPMLQRTLNLLNERGGVFPDLKVDGQCGPTTRAALKAYLAKRGSTGERIVLTGLNVLQGMRYFEIAEANGLQEAFTNGWLANRVGLAA